MPAFRCERPATITEVLDYLQQHGDSAVLHAGGSDLMVQLKNRAISPDVVVDLGSVDELNYIGEHQGYLHIGATTPISAIVEHPLLHGPFRGLREAALLVGSIHIRNRATLAGNICNASPAADTVPALVVLGAEVRIIGNGNERWLPVHQVITGPGKTVLGSDELVECIRIPIPNAPEGGGLRSAYLRMTRRRYEDLALVGVAVALFDGAEARICFGAVAPRFQRAQGTEAALIDFLHNRADFSVVEAAIHNEISPISDVRASSEYRLAMAAVLLRRAAAKAVERQGTGI